MFVNAPYMEHFESQPIQRACNYSTWAAFKHCTPGAGEAPSCDRGGRTSDDQRCVATAGRRKSDAAMLRPVMPPKEHRFTKRDCSNKSL